MLLRLLKDISTTGEFFHWIIHEVQETTPYPLPTTTLTRLKHTRTPGHGQVTTTRKGGI